MAARNPREVWTPEVVRRRIQTAHIVAGLQKFFRGKLKLSASQVRAAEILLRKTLPDQSAIAHSGNVWLGKPEELSEVELDRRIAAAAREETPSPGTQELPELH